MRRHLGFLLAVFALSQPASAQYIVGLRDAKAARTDSIFRAFDRTDSPGCAVGVYQDGKPLYARGYGMASLESGAPMTEFSVVVVRKAVEHKVRFGRVQQWVQPSTVGGPALKVKRERLRRVLEGTI